MVANRSPDEEEVTRDQELVLFHYCLGVAIAQWSHVEASLGGIAIKLFTADSLNREAIGVALHSAEGFRVKLKFVNEIVGRKLAHTSHLKQWNQLHKKANQQSRMRNELAHWVIGKYWNCQAGRRVVLRPWVFPKPTTDAERRKPPPGSKRILDLVRCADEFRMLGDSLQQFLGVVDPIAKKPRESPERSERQVTIHTLTRQIREVFSPQPSPSNPKP